MFESEEITLVRDAEAYLVPSGEKVTLKKGEKVRITQALGGSYTLFINGNLVKLDEKDADAIGKAPTTRDFDGETSAEGGKVDERVIWDQLRSCYDPEIPVNIVDLGLIYDCKITPRKEGGAHVDIKMTLTAPGCGMGGVIADEVERKVAMVPGVASVNVELVWEPQWNRDMMSEAARLQLGLL
ncbi:MAG: putative Fe-S cluster assembly protein SufT [FCB group bacterium]|nr:putative Fe-S cluster assembly protein SufT [FCB group bacterium]